MHVWSNLVCRVRAAAACMMQMICVTLPYTPLHHFTIYPLSLSVWSLPPCPHISTHLAFPPRVSSSRAQVSHRRTCFDVQAHTHTHTYTLTHSFRRVIASSLGCREGQGRSGTAELGGPYYLNPPAAKLTSHTSILLIDPLTISLVDGMIHGHTREHLRAHTPRVSRPSAVMKLSTCKGWVGSPPPSLGKHSRDRTITRYPSTIHDPRLHRE
ncbi:hypothetical protein F4810DRAFT_518208 [Camillea tinctor]|nr:hypothetical protein F4810DRAFT_518208 [Camillea tinctor]